MQSEIVTPLGAPEPLTIPTSIYEANVSKNAPNSLVLGPILVHHNILANIAWPMSPTNLTFEKTKFDCCGRKIDR
jgi:hypothetical protein